MVGEPIWLTYDEVSSIHDDQLVRYGGRAGINNDDLIHGALAAPVNLHLYEYEDDVLLLASRLAQAIAKGHGYTDGNKRTASMSMLLFLAVNGFYVDLPDSEDEQPLAEVMEMIAESIVDYHHLAEFLRPHTYPID